MRLIGQMFTQQYCACVLKGLLCGEYIASFAARLASHSLFSDWTGAGEKGLVTLGHILCLYQNLGRDYSLIFPRDPKIA